MREQTVVQAQRDDRAPRQRARRRRAEHLACTGSPATRSWCSCPACTDVGARQGDHPLHRACSSSRSSKPARRRRAKRCSSSTAARCRDDMEVITGAASAATPATRVLPGAEGRGRHRPGPAQRQADARREQPARGRLLADATTAPRKFGKVTGENIGRLARDHPRQPRRVRRRALRCGSTTKGASSGSFTHGGSRRPRR